MLTKMKSETQICKIPLRAQEPLKETNSIRTLNPSPKKRCRQPQLPREAKKVWKCPFLPLALHALSSHDLGNYNSFQWLFSYGGEVQSASLDM